ncbi:hormogonium polysaccharide biosynthesis protein HpsA [Oscillatoria sp. HE19RPO]|uniref:hormogonium polysaccharide biosynthesis protein HpsA n=1 Tax=Oscillatoria sp. HE19RPO TaxID=2954806 RepID=UPI0020C3A504|nr:hormogonium polysaccharide biosynthesis protein HpsA [Oscillatoria sp. HE19RPO]
MARKHKIQKALTHLVQAIIRFAQKLTSRNTYRFLRTAFVTSRRRLQAGFVLPTTTLLILVMFLVVSTLIFRSYQRSADVIGDFQRQELLNAATPAVDRARAKLEQLFNPEYLPPGIPDEKVLEQKLLERDENSQLSFTFSDETKVTLSSDNGEQAPAWLFKTDVNGNGNTNDPEDLVTVYTLIGRTDRNGQTIINGPNTLQTEEARANALVVRSGPILTSTNTDNDPACKIIDEDTGEERTQGWFPLNAAILKKNFQVYALTLPNRLIGNPSPSNPMLSTLEYQQDRYYEQGNKWGAWFRTDMEVYPGPIFNWNGAMHSEGSIFMKAIGGVNSYLISSKGSCFYEPNINSEISAKNQLVFAVPAAPDLDGAFTGVVNIDLHETAGDEATPPKDLIRLNNTNDSVNLTNAGAAINLLMDPEALLLDPANNQPRSDQGWTEDGAWEAADSQLSARVNLSDRIPPDTDQPPPTADCPPSLDDIYRADDRFGPKTGYGRAVPNPETGKCMIQEASNAGFDYGEYIQERSPEVATRELLLRDNPPSVDEPDEYGLDGYWERRARDQGTRIIVGQRLELGNAFGWIRDLNRDGDFADSGDKAPGNDPLNPYDLTTAYPSMRDRDNELRQRRTLYDNLAAVQATAIYHHKEEQSQGYYPMAYVATTVHPGTPATLKDSANFDTIQINGQPRIDFNFFTGKGTNGWEFDPFFGGNETSFASAINTSNNPLRIALENLAYFSGDPNGAFPVQPPQGPSVPGGRLPSAQLTMWGDFSNLRRIVQNLPGNLGIRHYPGAPGNSALIPDMSIADRSTLHTAAGALGMLAYNIKNLEDYDYENATNRSTGLGLSGTPTPPNTGLEGLATELWLLQDGDPSNGELGTLGNPGTYNQSPEAYIAALERKWMDAPPNDKNRMKEIVNLARFVMLKEQVERDRTYGFKRSDEDYSLNPPTSPGSSATPDLEGPPNNHANDRTFTFTPDTTIPIFGGTEFHISCDVTEPPAGTAPTATQGNSYFGLGFTNPTPSSSSPPPALTGSVIDQQRLISLSRLCSNEPKFPSLYYLFPTDNHDHATDSIGGVAQPASVPNNAEPYITNPYISTTANPTGTITYRVVNPQDIVLEPRAINFLDWELPNAAGPTGDNPNSSSQELILVNGQLRQVAIKDSALYDGRENMSVRLLNLDLNLLRQTEYNGDYFIPEESGLVYAFREDAVREDNIARLEQFERYADVPNSKKLNLKSVDYYADPDRRPYGFRFKNGATLRRRPTHNRSRGMSFITDQPVYTQGQFNLHHNNQTGQRNTIQEFTQTLGNTFTRAQFYNRSKAQRNADFADPSKDWWRNTEVIADSITILSDNFCDGSIEDGIIFAGIGSPAASDPAGYNGVRRLNEPNRRTIYGCNTNAQFTSYRNQNVPITALAAGTQWLRANPWENPNPNAQAGQTLWQNIDAGRIPKSPIAITKNGIAQITRTLPSNPPTLPTLYSQDAGNYTGSYQTFGTRRNLTRAAETTTNMILISSIIPSRTQQINGGLHNFPRVLEDWNRNVPLIIQGSLIQLHFSNYATAPFDQDAWEYRIMPNTGSSKQMPIGGAPIYQYYIEPLRNWGYDVALQRAPAGPAGRRMSQVSDKRDEFYREPAADNDYICKLRELPEINYPCR